MKHTSQNIAVYGGTFNPPTLGHMQVMQEILNLLEVLQQMEWRLIVLRIYNQLQA